MIKFDLYIDIYRPLHDVFAFVVTPENDFHWQYGTLLSAQISDGKLGPGSLFRAVGHFMGKRMENIYEVTEFEPNTEYGFRRRSGALDLHTLYTFDVIKGTTRMNVFVQFDPGAALMVNSSAAEKTMRKQYKENLAILKGILETSQFMEPIDAV